MSVLPVLGLDVSKKRVHAALWHEEHLFQHHFANDAAGFDSLAAWLERRAVTSVHACLEATGCYADALARYLHTGGHQVSLVNPARVTAFAQSRLTRTKNDKIDAHLLARFCAAVRPQLWTPPPPAQTILQALVRHLQSLQETRQQLCQRLTDGPQVEVVLASLRSVSATLEAEIKAVEGQIQDHLQSHPSLREQKALLCSIPGIGAKTAARLLGEIPLLKEYRQSKQVVAYAGLNPRERQSGTSLKSKAHLSKLGNAQVRHALYMPALVAMKHNPLLRAQAERLRQRGLRPLAVIGAVMRKLLQIAYGVVKSGQKFDVHHARSA